jgi:F-type H+-transporting ATPase subunit c
MLLQSAKAIAAGIAVSAISGAGVGIGTVFGSLITAVARNPGLTNQLFSYAILGFALTEAIALFTLMIVFLLLFAV